MNQREILNALGVTGHQATVAIPFLWLTPATTDPDMVPVRLLVQAIQSTMVRMGAVVPITGMFDVASARVLRELTGPNWPKMRWVEVCQAVLRAKRAGVSLAPPAPEVQMMPAEAVGFFDLPSVDLTTVAVVGAVAWFFWKSGKKKPAHPIGSKPYKIRPTL